ncbi:MAG: GntR family transcriptional regulator [Leeuwenhoekiella sp.]
MRIDDIEKNDIAKYKRVYNAFKKSIETKVLKTGDSIPSITEFSKEHKISRDTVFKAYSLLKNEGFIRSTPTKGYYIAKSKIKVLFLISTFKAYKEVLYHSFVQNLPKNIQVDLQFHHYKPKNFKAMLNADSGEYYKYIVMGFDHPEVIEAISKIDENKLLLIDLGLSSKSTKNYLLQDFGQSFYNCLVEALPLLGKYNAVNFIYPEFTYHPSESVAFFVKFCKEYNLDHNVIRDTRNFEVQKGTAYLTVNDRVLYKILDQCKINNLELGNQVGLISYNETPIKRFTIKGITVISVNFKKFGAKAAEFVVSDNTIQNILPTKLIIRESL